MFPKKDVFPVLQYASTYSSEATRLIHTFESGQASIHSKQKHNLVMVLLFYFVIKQQTLCKFSASVVTQSILVTSILCFVYLKWE